MKQRIFGALLLFGAVVVISGCIYVGNLRPIAAFTATPATGITPLTVSFDASASEDTDGTIVSYIWDFGDGQTASTTALTTHVYVVQSESRVFTAILQVEDDLGATDTAVGNITVNPVP